VGAAARWQADPPSVLTSTHPPKGWAPGFWLSPTFRDDSPPLRQRIRSRPVLSNESLPVVLLSLDRGDRDGVDPTTSGARHWEHLRLIWHNMVMARRQTLIQLDDARIAALDQRAAASGRSRSDLIREAVDLLLGTGDEAAIDAAIVAGYKRDPAPDQDPWTLRGALAAIRAEPW